MTQPKPVYVLGAGGYGKVVVSTLQAAGVPVTGLFDGILETPAELKATI